MMQSPSPEGTAAQEPAEVPGQLSFDDLTRQLCEALGGGEWFLLVDDDDWDRAPVRRRRKGS